MLSRKESIALGATGLASLNLGHAKEDHGHHKAKAKRVIYLYMSGGPSQFESFDEKPELKKQHLKPLPPSFTKGVKLAFLQYSQLKCYGGTADFKRCGNSGQSISDFFPHLQKMADDLCIVRSLQTEQVNHDPAHTFMNTGAAITGRPSFGSWLNYAFKPKTQNLPSNIVLRSGPLGQPVPTTMWHNGFLPSHYQGVEFYTKGMPLNFIHSPKGVSKSGQYQAIETIKALNSELYKSEEDPEILTRNRQYELAYRMQDSIPELADFSNESEATKKLYGVDQPNGTFASNCLMARRMAERGVSYIQVIHTGWDHHGGIKKGMASRAKDVDKGCAALIADLKQRGMLDDTLIIWGGEFGRTPMAQGSGRDHHTKSGSMWFAGGGVKAGTTYGETDPLGFGVVKDPFHVHDFHATALHLLGVNHKKLTYKYKGRNFRLTDVHGKVIKKILA